MSKRLDPGSHGRVSSPAFLVSHLDFFLLVFLCMMELVVVAELCSAESEDPSRGYGVQMCLGLGTEAHPEDICLRKLRG